MIFWILPILFILFYWNNADPPIRDILSPLVVLSFAFGNFLLYPVSKISSLVILNLIIDSVADYLMDSENLDLPIFLFSIGHFIKQIIFSHVFSRIYPSSNISRIFAHGFTLILIMTLLVTDGYLISIASYGLIVATTFIQICLAKRSLSMGFLLFVISDLIIAIELMFGQMRPRQIRVICVPILYWTSEYILAQDIMYEYLNYLN